MGDNLAVVKKAESPSQLALAELQKRVEEDTDLPAAIKDAFLEDLKSASLAALANLRTALGNEDNHGAA